MGQRLRHYKALMRKNWINWKRTILSSLCELLCPVALMVILTLARLAVKINQVDATSYINQSSIFHPVYNNTVNATNITETFANLDAKFGSFYNFSLLQIFNNPITQFIPNSCAATKTDKIRDTIAIGPINSISYQVVQQLETLKIQQGALYDYLNQNTSVEAKMLNSYLTQIGYNITMLSTPFKFKYYDSQQAISDYVGSSQFNTNDENPGICFGFSLTVNSDTDYELSLMFFDNNKQDKWQSIPDQLNPSYSIYQRDSQLNYYEMYSKYGFSFIQNWFANAVLQQVSPGVVSPSIALTTIPFKVNAYLDDSFKQVIGSMLPFFMLLMYILPVYRTLQRIISEKETKARESMKMMGLQDSSYWISWFTYYTIIVTIISILCTILLSFKVINYSSKGYLFLFFWVYGMSLFGLIMIFQALFNVARVGAIAGTLIYFGTSFINQAVNSATVSISQKTAASILSTVAVSLGAGTMGTLETAGIGIHNSNIDSVINNYSFQNCLIMMAVSFGSFTLLGLYLDNVIPSTYGLRRPFYYFLTCSYWCGGKKKKNAKISNGDIEMSDMLEMKSLKQENFEPPSQDLSKQEQEHKILKIEGLKKVFSNGFQAVNGLNVKMYNGQIFALLGHNGAGKTTTISMLTGLIGASAGDCEVFGYNLFEEMNEVRQFLGVCPQHDILFDLLTPREHLEIFCDFKGVDSKTKKEEIEKMLIDVDLTNYKSTMAKNLSGGSRRKLSVAIALIGGSKFVLLDEPTAGMDLTARRKLWNMLKNYKQNRIIILTTHYMDEADILGDRIGIMTEGQLYCLGSSLFLKNRFGVGYKLTMVKTKKEQNIKVGKFLESKIGEVKKLSEVSSEITYQIPTNLSYKFKTFFEEFDNSLKDLDIRSYGISITTLEEVFLKVGHAEKEDDIKEMNDNVNNQLLDDTSEELANYTIVEQYEKGVLNVFNIHLGALFRKRIFIYKKNYKGLFVEVLIPVLLVLIGFAFSKVQFNVSSPYRQLSPKQLPYQQRILLNEYLVQASTTTNDNISPQFLVSQLPDSFNAFAPTYQDYSNLNYGNNQSLLLVQFDNDTFNQQYDGTLMPYRYGSYFIYQANNKTKQFRIANFVNTTSQDSAALYPQFIYEAILKAATGNPNFSFKVTNAPFPITQQLRNRAAQASGSFIIFVIGIGFALIPASIISFILSEREKNLKHMQLISGMSLTAYWISNLIFDIIKAMIPMLLVIALMYIFQLGYDDVWTVFLMFPIGIVPFTYASSFLFSNENVAQTVTIFLHFVISAIGGIIVFILRIIDTTEYIGDYLLWILKIVPSFCLTDSVMFASSKQALFSSRPTLSQNDFDIQNMGGDLLLLGCHFVCWILVLIILEAGLFRCLKKALVCSQNIPPKQDLELDEDVLEEEKRVSDFVSNYKRSNSKVLKRQYTSEMQVCVNKFRKVYTTGCKQSQVAVERTSFGLDYGECFALLGINGAGKSTTFKSLTNDIQSTSGDIIINGKNVNTQFNEIRKMIGYCPQHDCIFDLMTVEEHLDYYARIKGILKNKREALINKQIKDMNLEEHRKKPAGTLSGGNKRKLSVALAVLGNPPIILLDEPSAGMDPQARRFMWSVVANISQKRHKSAVILTTHSMEEAEALSTKMGIMVKGGVFKCFGSSQHIKNKFGTGYEIEVKVKKITAEDLKGLRQQLFIQEQATMMTFQACQDVMRKRGIEELLIQELMEGGLGADIYKEALDNKGLVSVESFLNWLHIELHGIRIIYSLIEQFGQVEMLEHYNDYYKMRIPRRDKSIGYVFGMIEDKKLVYGITDYSVSQTTLEQIFQTFANLQIDQQGQATYEKGESGMIIRKAAFSKSQSQIQ